jgi:hypothetical protein
MSNLKEKYIHYRIAKMQAKAEYDSTRQWHVDMCNCSRCQAFEAWYALPWYSRWWAWIFYP